MKSFWTPYGASLLVLILAGAPLRAGNELATVASAADVLQALSAIPFKCIPPALLHDARAVAIFPHVVKFGLIVDRRFGHGVVMVRQPDGAWSDPIFATLEGGGIGLEAGVEATDLVLVFKSPGSLDRILRGKGRLTLGTDATVAAGPLGREAEVGTDGRRLLPDVYTYSRSRGLFAGVALQGAVLKIDGHANDAFYGLHNGRPEDVLGRHGDAFPVVENLKAQLNGLSGKVVVATPVMVIPTLPPSPVPMPPSPH